MRVLAVAGAPDIKQKLAAGTEILGKPYKNAIDGFDMTDYLEGKVADSPRDWFVYVNDDGDIVAVRWKDW